MTRMVLIPALNEEDRVERAVQGAREALRRQGDIVLVVDDGSTDATAERARAAGATVIRHERNLGYGEALQTGFRHFRDSGCAVFAQMDADGQHNARYIASLFEPIERDAADVVIGSRFLDPRLGGNYKAGVLIGMGIKGLSFIASHFVGKRISDPTSGFRAFSRRTLDVLLGPHYPHDFPDAEALILLHRCGYRICEVPVPMYAQPKEKSLHSGWEPVSYLFRTIPVLWRAVTVPVETKGRSDFERRDAGR